VSDIPPQQGIGTSNEEDGITIGGPIPWFSVSLTIHADDLDPDEITPACSASSLIRRNARVLRCRLAATIHHAFPKSELVNQLPFGAGTGV
jgi:hypothetical protein